MIHYYLEFFIEGYYWKISKDRRGVEISIQQVINCNGQGYTKSIILDCVIKLPILEMTINRDS